MTMTLPMLLTLSRIVLIPVMVLVFILSPEVLWVRVLTTIIFCIAAVTDVLDGWLARKWQQSSRLGAFLDPVADKLLVATALVLLIHRYESLLLTLPALVIIGREISVSALREWMAELRARTTIQSNALGKWKTFMQMSAIPLLLFGSPLESGVFWLTAVVGYLMLYLAAVLTIWSMIGYLQSAWPTLRFGNLDSATAKTDDASHNDPA